MTHYRGEVVREVGILELQKKPGEGGILNNREENARWGNTTRNRYNTHAVEDL